MFLKSRRCFIFSVKSMNILFRLLEINVEEEIAKLTTELNYTKGFLKSVQGKLSNENL
jgi:valyl-tRNA synthetase